MVMSEIMKHALDYLNNIDYVGLEAAPNRLNDYQSGVYEIFNHKPMEIKWL